MGTKERTRLTAGLATWELRGRTAGHSYWKRRREWERTNADRWLPITTSQRIYRTELSSSYDTEHQPLTYVIIPRRYLILREPSESTGSALFKRLQPPVPHEFCVFQHAQQSYVGSFCLAPRDDQWSHFNGQWRIQRRALAIYRFARAIRLRRWSLRQDPGSYHAKRPGSSLRVWSETPCRPHSYMRMYQRLGSIYIHIGAFCTPSKSSWGAWQSRWPSAWSPWLRVVFPDLWIGSYYLVSSYCFLMGSALTENTGRRLVIHSRR